MYVIHTQVGQFTYYVEVFPDQPSAYILQGLSDNGTGFMNSNAAEMWAGGLTKKYDYNIKWIPGHTKRK